MRKEKNNTLWAHVIDVQIYSRSQRHSQYSLEDPVQSATSYAAYLYDYESLFSNRNHNPISKLRKKLRFEPDLPNYIESVAGIGYKFEHL